MSDTTDPASDGDTSDDPGGSADAGAATTTPTFSQADIDRIVRDRLNRQKAQFADYDELKTRAARLDEIEAAQKTELEKAQEKLQQFEKQAADATQLAADNALRAAVISEAARKNVVDPDAVLALLDKSLLELDDSGAPKNLSDAIDSLLQAKPYLAGTRPTGSADLGARGSSEPGQLSREDISALSAAGKHAEILQAKAQGRLANVLGTKP